MSIDHHIEYRNPNYTEINNNKKNNISILYKLISITIRNT